MFESRSPDEERALNTFWNELVRPSGAQDAAEHPSGSSLADAVQRLHELGTAPPPASSRERVRRGLRGAYASVPNGKEPTVHTMTSTLQLDSHQPAQLRPVLSRSRWLTWPLGTYAAAAILLATIAALAAVTLTQFGDHDHSANLAISAPATPSPSADLTDATLFDFVLPVGSLPTGLNRRIDLAYIYVDVGSTGSWDGSCCPGVMVEHLVAGEISFTSKAEAQVMRADGTLEPLAAGSKADLRPGDTFIARHEAEFSADNSGAEPAQLIEWLYQQEYFSFIAHDLPGWGGPGGKSTNKVLPEFEGNIEITLERHVLDPGEGDAAFPSNGVRQVVSPNIETDILTVSVDGEYAAYDSRDETTTAYVLEVTPLGAGSAHPIVNLPPPPQP